jgi:hypothetical protein
MSWSKDTGPEVSQGVDGDLAAVYQGGENFLARAQMLSNMRAEADKAVKALKEGRDIDWTLDRALEARKEADRLAAKAKETLEAAVKQHDASVRDSNAEAHSLIQRATADAAVIAAGAEQAKADAARYVDQQRAKAEEIIRGAEARMAEAIVLQSQTTRDMGRVKEVEDAARATIDKYEALSAKLQARLAKLNSAMREDSGS